MTDPDNWLPSDYAARKHVGWALYPLHGALKVNNFISSFHIETFCTQMILEKTHQETVGQQHLSSSASLMHIAR